ncbi:AlpA family phage regulatory protein [Dyadobacter chenwenxiniae]|uniref:AlpA family phage regulatory protein n=1 Tax=Dyadobacter chenwenxiniae TaxID=2906456 RepID=A0A9X1PJ71_9BACT|nr:AlpA family phage regulatory protein [Dyadobacter chenwenxiniae]MCF0061340.1 AlpA family phage regulatory protein [Dyadobacter chenwenxiniae]UON81162.1 AlpA family phage regulatory protein [Dyadobacter chenwenxiniae]
MDQSESTAILDRFLRLPEVLKLIPVSKATWWNGCRSGRFPKPCKLGPRTTAWKASDIQECMAKYSSPVWHSDS